MRRCSPVRPPGRAEHRTTKHGFEFVGNLHNSPKCCNAGGRCGTETRSKIYAACYSLLRRCMPVSQCDVAWGAPPAARFLSAVWITTAAFHYTSTAVRHFTAARSVSCHCIRTVMPSVQSRSCLLSSSSLQSHTVTGLSTRSRRHMRPRSR